MNLVINQISNNFKKFKIMLQTIAFSFLQGVLVFALTAIILNKEKASKLPGGAILAAFIFSPWWIALVCALVGHFGTAFLVKKNL